MLGTDALVRVASPHRRPDEQELQKVWSPVVALDLHADADDAVGVHGRSLLLHPMNREPAGVIHGPADDLQLLVPRRAIALPPDVIDGAAEDEAERVEPHALDAQQLIHGEIAGERT